MSEQFISKVYGASLALKEVVNKTDVISATRIDTSADLLLKTENLQLTGSFKIRGAYYKMSTLAAEQAKRGIVACSAGNHAQGVALAAAKRGIDATIFLPSISPISKVEATKSFGAKVVLVDGVYDDAYKAALKHMEQTDKFFVHPFSDEDVIAGQGTIALEILDQISDLDAVVVPIGGGGLASGVGFVIKTLNPNCKVYGVQASGAAGMFDSFKSNEAIKLDRVSTFADGIAVKAPSELTYSMCKKYLDDIVTVTDDQIAAAILALMEQQKLVTEGAGAASVAAVMFDKLPINGKRVCAILSGGNIDVNILYKVIDRGLLTSGRLSDMTIDLLDKPGQLRDVSGMLAMLGANVVKVNHNYGEENTDINGCTLHITIQTRNSAHIADIHREFKKAGYIVR